MFCYTRDIYPNTQELPSPVIPNHLKNNIFFFNSCEYISGVFN